MSSVSTAGVVAVLIAGVSLTRGCGLIVHTELVRRAQTSYNDPTFGNGFVERVLQANPGAVQAGAPFPDTMYDGLCAGGRYHEVAEDTHWGHWQITAWDYFHEKYPHPENNPKAQTLMAFLLGVASHSVADIGWHNLSGLKDGLIQMLADTTFDGVYNTAHHFTDVGGDIIGMELWNASFHREWVVPTDDLYDIFMRYYDNNQESVPEKSVLEGCIAEMYGVRELETVAGSLIYPLITQASSLLEDELEDYFEGGMSDMTSWTRMFWDQLLYIAKHGSEGCSAEGGNPREQNPMKIKCINRKHSTNRNSQIVPEKKRNSSGMPQIHKKSKRSFFMDLFNLNPGDIASYVSKDTKKGGEMKVSVDTNSLVNRLADHTFTKYLTEIELKVGFKNDYQAIPTTRQPSLTFPDPQIPNNFSAFARIGQSVLSAYIDKDSMEDLVIAAPGLQTSEPENPGCVFYIPTASMPQTICSPSGGLYGTFGHSIAFQDYISTSKPMLYVGAPTLGLEKCMDCYEGKVFGYDISGPVSDQPAKVMSHNGTTGSRTNTFGWALAVTPSTQKLLVGSRHISFEEGVHQGGSVMVEDDQNEEIVGDQRYEWTGSAVVSFTDSSGKELVAIGSPNFDLTKEDGCKGECPKLSAGKVEVREVETMNLVKTLHGTASFEGFGSSLAAGKARFGQEVKNVLAVGSPTYSYHDGVFDHKFSGAVNLYDIDLKPLAFDHLTTLRGYKANGHFGKSLTVTPVSGKLVIGAPNEGKSSTGHLGPGKVYVFDRMVEGLIRDHILGVIRAECNGDDCLGPEEILLPVDETDKGQQFGSFVTSGPMDYIIVSAPRKRFEEREQVGAVYIYHPW